MLCGFRCLKCIIEIDILSLVAVVGVVFGEREEVVVYGWTLGGCVYKR